MAFNYSTVRWIVNGELLDQTVSNRPTIDLAELVTSYLNNQMLTTDQIDATYYNRDTIDQHFTFYYTKEQVDENFYNKIESDSKFQLKSDSDEGFYTKEESDLRYYTRDQINNSYYNKNYVDESLYTKQQVDDLLQGFDPENRTKTVQLDESHVYVLEDTDISNLVRFVSHTEEPPTTLTVTMSNPEMGRLGDVIRMIAPDSVEFTDGDEAFSFVSTVDGNILNPMTAIDRLPAMRSGNAVVTLEKIKETGSGMGDWILHGDVAVYTAADLWIRTILRSDLNVQQLLPFISHVLFPRLVGGVWEWKPISFMDSLVAGNTVKLNTTANENVDSLNLTSEGASVDLSSFVIVTKPIPQGQHAHVTATESQWSGSGQRRISILDELPESPDAFEGNANFVSNRTYASEVSLDGTPMYICIKSLDDTIKATNVGLQVHFE